MYLPEYIFSIVGKQLSSILKTDCELGATGFRVLKDTRDFFEVQGKEFVPSEQCEWTGFHFYDSIRPSDAAEADPYTSSKCPIHSFEIASHFVAFNFHQEDRGYGVRILPAFNEKKYGQSEGAKEGISFKASLTRYIDDPIQVINQISKDSWQGVQQRQRNCVAVLVDYRINVRVCELEEGMGCDVFTVVL